MTRYGLFIDYEYCSGCKVCVTACKMEHGFEPNDFGIVLPHLSMGMTNDFDIAVEEGATWVRLGTFLFGQRPKWKPEYTPDEG